MIPILAFLMVVLGIVATAGAASSPPSISNCGKLVQRPAKLIIACGDGNYWLSSLKWSSWGGATAAATGTATANDCTPYCAAGHFHSYPVTVIASRPTTCPTSRRYMRVTVHYGSTRPRSYAKNDVITFTCKY